MSFYFRRGRDVCQNRIYLLTPRAPLWASRAVTTIHPHLQELSIPSHLDESTARTGNDIVSTIYDVGLAGITLPATFEMLWTSRVEMQNRVAGNKVQMA
jgi:hypothetical protein